MVNKASSLMPKTFFSLQVSPLYEPQFFIIQLHDAATHSCLGCVLIEKKCAKKTDTEFIDRQPIFIKVLIL